MNALRGLRVALRMASLVGVALATLSPHKTECDGRPCRPGEGNPTVTHDNNPYEGPTMPPDVLKSVVHVPDPLSAEYAPLVAFAKETVKHHHLLFMTAADFDFREIALNWHKALERLGHGNALVYGYDREVVGHLTSRGVPTFDGSANMAAWNTTRMSRHIQQAEAERHLAAAAVAASGLDVLLMESTMVVLKDPMPLLHEVSKADVDMAVPRGSCGDKPPIGCNNPLWALAFLRGAGTKEQRDRAVAWQLAGVKHGMVDFYLRWWNGAHCILSGFGKRFAGCGLQLEGGVSPASMKERTTMAIVTAPRCDGLRVGLLPPAFFQSHVLYGRNEPSDAMIGRSAKPGPQRDRLRLDRYDEKDFTDLVMAMKADGLWFL